jgi:ATP-binding cassette, subfamily B, bacterial
VQMFRIDSRLAGLVVLLMPVLILILKIVGRHLRPLSNQLQEEQATAVAIVEENLGMLPVIKTFTRETLEALRHARQTTKVMELSIAQSRIYAALEPAVQFIAATGVVLLLWLANGRSGAARLAPGELVSFLLYAALLARPISTLASVYGQTQMARGALQRLQSVLTERPEPIGRGADLPRVRGEIAFRNVSFAYPGRPTTFHDVSLVIKAGETLAITGQNGAGKSTLVHLLMRLHELGAGQILIDGIDIADVTLSSLRRQIGIVPQHVLLFNGSVHENIGYGNPDAPADAVERAARAAQAHAFVMWLPARYDTIIGDNGIRLSGGQRQRIALARALIKDPPILILDEATAMFDPAGERSFIEECHDVLAKRTVILITHRPASLALADRVVKLEDGRVSVVRRNSQAA